MTHTAGRTKLIVTIALALSAVNAARAEDLVFETRTVKLVIQPDAVAVSLKDKGTGRELLRQGLAFAAVRKAGTLFPASAVIRRDSLLLVKFGATGIQADFRITERPEYLTVELASYRGDGIEEIRLMQLDVALANAGEPLAVRSDSQFAVSLVGLSPRVEARVPREMFASVFPELGMQGERVAIIAAPTPHFLGAVRKVERDFGLPSPVLARKWAKLSPEVRTSYLFTDLTEANADETIRYAKLGGFRYILIYSFAWSASLGSYPINKQNFPRGEVSLKAVIDKCHAAGLKVGMHMLTSLIGKNDPLAGPKPAPGLLKDAQATLAVDVDEKASQLAIRPSGAMAPAGFPPDNGAISIYGPASDILIDDEIIHYSQIKDGAFVHCVRGFAGTRPALHRAGATIYHLVEREGSYLADLRTSLKDSISARIAGLINRCGFDMIYFDSGDANDANGPGWYWMGPQQTQIWSMSRRELLVQGSAITDWTWHISSRGTSDDYSAVAVKEYLDYHKIADFWKSYTNDFLPAELGWTGFLTATPDHPATTPDEVEHYGVRMLALDSPVSLETTLLALKQNRRTEEMLKLLGAYEQLRLSASVPKAVREKLAAGEWHMTRPGEFHPIRYDTHRIILPAEISLRNDFDAQPLKFRLQAVPTLAAIGESSNIPLLRAEATVEVPPPEENAALPGSLIRRFEFPEAIDLTKHRALAVRLDVEGLHEMPAQPAVLNIQLQAGAFYRDYYIDLKENGIQTIILPEAGTKRMLAEFRPVSSNYYFKSAMYIFDYGKVNAMNLRWMRYPRQSPVRCRVGLVEALEERDSIVEDLSISTGDSRIKLPRGMKTGDYIEYWGDGVFHVFDQNGGSLATFPSQSRPQLAHGENKLNIAAARPGNIVFTAITSER